MHLGIYTFTGDPDELLSAYERLMAGLPADGSDVHLCVRRPDGITIYDTCPSREAFEQFSTSRGFRDALTAAGLPAPAIADAAVHTARTRTRRLA